MTSMEDALAARKDAAEKEKRKEESPRANWNFICPTSLHRRGSSRPSLHR